MSEELNQTQIIQEFLKEVKNKLPGWLKDKKSELKDVLSELESHIWEKSEEIAAGQEIQIQHVQHAVQSMGNPRDIAAEYKKRGTPKLWISQELFSAYVRTFGIVVAVIVGVNLISFIVDVVTNGFNESLWSYLDGIWSSALGAFLIVTVIFVALSVEGYLPEDFKRSKGRYQLKSIPAEKADSLDKLDKKSKAKRPKQVKAPLKRGELLIGGIITLLIGAAMYAQVWVYIPLVETIGADMTWLIRVAGVFTMAGGAINVVQSMLDLTNYFAQRLLISIKTILDLVFIYFIVELISIVSIVSPISDPILYDIFVLYPDVYFNIVIGVKVLVGISIFGTIVGSISNIHKIVTLRVKFEEYNRYQEI